MQLINDPLKVFKVYVSTFLNLIWSIPGMSLSLFAFPNKVSWSTDPIALIIHINSFWWYSWLPGMKGVRALTIGNVVLLGKDILDKDLEHELVHVRQFE